MIVGIYQAKHHRACLMKEDDLIIEEFQIKFTGSSGSWDSRFKPFKAT
jgi:hypothetical protein